MTESALENLLKENPNLKILGEKKLSPTPQQKQIETAKGTHPPDKMNNLEKSYAQFLDVEKYKREILEWKYEPIALRLSGMRCVYNPDFLVVGKNLEIIFVEIKGKHCWEDSLVKFKVASEQFPFFKFCWVTKKDGVFCRRYALGGVWLKNDV